MMVALALVAAVLAAWCLHELEDYPPVAIAGSSLGAREEALVRAVADAFFPPGGAIPVSGNAAGVPEYLSAYLHRSAGAQRFMIRLLLAFLEFQPFLFGPRRARFTRLSQADRILSLADASTSGLYFRRVCFISMRALLTMAYLANAEVARCMRLEDNPDPFGIGDRIFERDPREVLA